MRRGTRYALARCARTTTASQITRHAREGAHAHPANAPPQAQPEGGEPPNSRTGHCFARPTPRGRKRHALRKLGRAKRWPEGVSGFGFPSGCAEERSGQRIRARDCLSEASSSETPLDASTAGCPQRSEGTQPVGSLFLGLLSFGEAKESESPAGARPGPRTRQRHTTSYKNNSY